MSRWATARLELRRVCKNEDLKTNVQADGTLNLRFSNFCHTNKIREKKPLQISAKILVYFSIIWRYDGIFISYNYNYLHSIIVIDLNLSIAPLTFWVHGRISEIKKVYFSFVIRWCKYYCLKKYNFVSNSIT